MSNVFFPYWDFCFLIIIIIILPNLVKLAVLFCFVCLFVCFFVLFFIFVLFVVLFCFVFNKLLNSWLKIILKIDQNMFIFSPPKISDFIFFKTFLKTFFQLMCFGSLCQQKKKKVLTDPYLGGPSTPRTFFPRRLKT